MLLSLLGMPLLILPELIYISLLCGVVPPSSASRVTSPLCIPTDGRTHCAVIRVPNMLALTNAGALGGSAPPPLSVCLLKKSISKMTF